MCLLTRCAEKNRRALPQFIFAKHADLNLTMGSVRQTQTEEYATKAVCTLQKCQDYEGQKLKKYSRFKDTKIHDNELQCVVWD